MHTLRLAHVEWDSGKAKLNLRKHRVHFVDAAIALEDPLGITVADVSFPEDRFVTLCQDPHGRLLVVVYSTRADRVRLISARRATPRERGVYEETR